MFRLVRLWLILVSGLLLACNGQPDERPVHELAVATGCDPLHKPCEAMADGRRLSLFFADGVRYLTPFTIRLVATGFDDSAVEAVSVAFAMTGMDMGVNRFALQKRDDAGVFEGMGMIPICVSGRKDWQVTVELQTRQGLYRARYRILVTADQ